MIGGNSFKRLRNIRLQQISCFGASGSFYVPPFVIAYSPFWPPLIRWVLALTIAQHSGLRFVILDRFDVLDLPGRGHLLGMLVAKPQTIDSAIVCGTLKTNPAKLLATNNAVWIEGGIEASDQQLQQAR